jgi:energy-coupling factor transporter transmembrane protein EcfT
MRATRTLAGDVTGPILLGSLVGSLAGAHAALVAACVAVALLGAAASGAGLPRSAWLVRLAVAAGIAIMLNAWLTAGTRLPGPLPVTGQGIAAGLLLALRLTGAAIALHGLAAAWPGERAADELAARARPLEWIGVPLRACRAVIGLGLRFAPLVAHEAGRIARLQDARAGGPPRTRLEWLARRKAVAVPFMVCALERAERVALAMEARHYRVRPIASPPRRPAAELAGWTLAVVALLWRS